MKAEHLIARLGLQPLPDEGGYYKETYRSSQKLGERSLSTAIYYMLTSNANSKLHRLKSDEIYHFYFGDPVQMLLLYPNGESRVVFLGHNFLASQKSQFLVPEGTWMGSMVIEGEHGYAFMGTTVSPGFEFSDFELGDQGELIDMYPQHKGLIQELT